MNEWMDGRGVDDWMDGWVADEAEGLKKKGSSQGQPVQTADSTEPR